MAEQVVTGQSGAEVCPESDAPRWFRAAIARTPTHHDLDVDGCPIHLRCWGDDGLPVVVLVHGGGANSAWWDHIGPLLADTHRTVALDLSGHGDSGHRDAYSLELWAHEVLAATEFADAGGAAAAATGRRPVVVGHSMGGWVAATVGARYGGTLDGVVIIDSPLNDQPPEEEHLRRRRRPTRVYPTREEAAGHFRTAPPQDVILPYVREHVAWESLHATGGGWTWKFDPSLFGQARLLLRDLLPALRCRAAFIRSEFGLVPPRMAGTIDRLLGYRAPIVELPDAGHHPMFDQPLPLVTALRMLLMQWALAGPAADGGAAGNGSAGPAGAR